ncbi:hypothetical protein GOP47_0001843 [Adiantum capillus-veneris]|uniref:Uncharacterized protein n=1 Tax=Adiantum capillus-veneris TaxID=13818 RepID=A0A9D4V9T3_ADICA|nr:hypothetical protein GOP47_0001843 [Adiantum capillus-veneris]
MEYGEKGYGGGKWRGYCGWSEDCKDGVHGGGAGYRCMEYGRKGYGGGKWRGYCGNCIGYGGAGG